jgi:serine/threonine-protein kinase
VFRGGFQRCPNDGSRLSQSSEDPLVGTVLAERYYVEGIIGDGGIGRVYRAQHTRMSRRFAIKVPFGELGYDHKQRARFSNEAEAASRLSHPNVIGVVDVGETSEGLFYMAMDLAEGQNLADAICEGPMDPARALNIVVQLAEGLAHAHERDLVHRDLKPENILLGRGVEGREQPRIVDFGLAIVDADEPRKNRLTTDGVVLGTPHYMAPEQATDEPLDFRTDIFALGLIVFEMLAGIHPFDGAPMDVARQNLSRELPTIYARSRVRVDPLLEALVSWMTQKSPGDRPSQTIQIAHVTRALIQGDRKGARELLPAALRPVEELEPATSSTQSAAAPPSATSATSAGEPRIQAGVAHMPAGVPQMPEQAELLHPTERVEETGGSRKRFVVVHAIVLAVLAGVIGVVMLAGGGGDKEKVAIVEDAAVLVVPLDDAAPDAGDVDAAEMIVEPVDAAPVAIDAGRRNPPPPRVDAAVERPRPVDAGVSRPPPPIDAGVTTPQTSNASLRQLYEQVGTALDKAIVKYGKDKTEAFKRRYSDIPPYLEAIRKDDLRKQAETKLLALKRDLAALR